MPRSVRLEALRKLDSLRTHLSAMHYHLEWLIEQYKDAHPEWAERFLAADQALEEYDAAIQRMSEEL